METQFTNDEAANFSKNLGSNRERSTLNLASQIKDGARDIADNLRERVSHVASDVKDYGGQSLETTVSLIKRYPARSLLCGFGLGVVAGALLSRK